MRAMAVMAVVMCAGTAAADTTWTISVSDSGGGSLQTTTSGGLDKAGTNAIDATSTVVQVTCSGAGAAQCTNITVQQVTSGTPVPLAPTATPTATALTVALDGHQVQASTRLQLFVTGRALPFFDAALAPAVPASGTTQKPLKDLLLTDCSRTPINALPYHDNTAEMVVSPAGNLLSEAAQNIDENDEVIVTVVADARLLPTLHVVRKSAIRTVNGPNIAGASVLVPQELINRQAAGAAQSCGTAKFTLRDFAAGTGEIEIRALTTGDDVVLGSLSFLVNPLYTGMFSLGAMWTHQIDPSFKLGANGAIRATERGQGAILYTLFYTPFLHGRRDFEKHASLFSWDRLNPSVGLVLNDPLEHAIAGFSYDLDYGVVLTLGVHVGHIQELAGLKVGDMFAGAEDQIPVRKHWETTYFAGVSIDLRAAMQLLKSALVAK